jgi:hypothetical protein
MASKRRCVSQAPEYHNLLSLLKFGCYLAISVTVVSLKNVVREAIAGSNACS